MKKVFSLILALAMCLPLCACGANNNVIPQSNRVAIPDVVDVDETTAKTILVSNTLIPSVQYVHDDTIKKGNVIEIEPAVGTKVDPNTKVTIYVSAGPIYKVEYTPLPTN